MKIIVKTGEASYRYIESVNEFRFEEKDNMITVKTDKETFYILGDIKAWLQSISIEDDEDKDAAICRVFAKDMVAFINQEFSIEILSPHIPFPIGINPPPPVLNNPYWYGPDGGPRIDVTANTEYYPAYGTYYSAHGGCAGNPKNYPK